MKKLRFLLVIAILCLCASPAYALIRTRNVDVDDAGTGDSKFDYKVAYVFATGDVAASTSLTDVPVPMAYVKQQSFYYAMPFKGTIVGVSIASKEALTTGSATVDVTINGTVTGVRTALDADSTVAYSISGLVATHTQYNASTLAYNDDSPNNLGGGYHDSTHQYGKATELAVGDYLGVQIETSSDIVPAASHYVVTVIILQ